MRLIDADELKKVLMETACVPGTIGEVTAQIFCGIIDEQPEAIVRCKECLLHGICRFEKGLGLDGFCSQAERGTDGENV
jgi:hypothetical protein